MKTLVSILFTSLVLTVQAQNLAGTWQNDEAGVSVRILATDKYLSVTEFGPKEFIKTWGGKYELQKGGSVQIKVEFNSADPSMVGTEQTYNVKLKKKTLDFNSKAFQKANPERKDDLSGLWMITGRANPQGEISRMNPGARRTYKMMGDGHFQWLAINTQTGEFSGTGGGKYTLKDGKYVETIEFFSRDNSRVGAVLEFDAKVQNGEWTHSGKSSKGDPIKEIWTKQ
jgi:hypothetical protein